MRASLAALEDPALHMLDKPFANETLCERVLELAGARLAVAQ
jgi:hypothetical protein